jgi:hypothetical protein
VNSEQGEERKGEMISTLRNRHYSLPFTFHFSLFRYFDSLLFRCSFGFFISCVDVTGHSNAGIVRKHTIQSPRAVFRPIGY